ncbi:hypothetical protein BVRB_1g005650 [Beta vulgaris subsp. vulgaris]|nr:hypothetical protein BVRB_1g005650 [Beta vulgaris subsp. vulgaris]
METSRPSNRMFFRNRSTFFPPHFHTSRRFSRCFGSPNLAPNLRFGSEATDEVDCCFRGDQQWRADDRCLPGGVC